MSLSWLYLYYLTAVSCEDCMSFTHAHYISTVHQVSNYEQK